MQLHRVFLRPGIIAHAWNDSLNGVLANRVCLVSVTGNIWLTGWTALNPWNLNRSGEIKGNAPPTNYYRGLCVLGDDVLSCVETSGWEWPPVDSAFGGLRFVCRSRLRILHVIRLGENSKRSDQARHLRDRFSHQVDIDNCRRARLVYETG